MREAQINDHTAGGNRLSVRRWPGDRPALLALHGFTGAGADFDPLARRLPNELRAPDLLGHARSEVPAEPGEYRFDAQARGLAELARGLGASRPALLGYSFGGRLALQLLLDAPAELRAAILVGASPGIADAAARAERRLADATLAERIESLGAPTFMSEWARVPLIATQERIAPGDRERMRRERALHAAEGLAGALRGAGAGSMPSLWDRLGEIELPVLLITGAEDAKFDAIASRMLAALPHAEHAKLPGAGHCAHLEAPDAAATAIAEFLARAA